MKLSLPREYFVLLGIQVLEYRSWGIITAIFTTLFPLAMIYGFSLIGGGVPEDGLIYLVTGAAIISLVTVGITATSQELASMRREGVLEYYASLPISKAGLLASLLTVRVVMVIPGIVLTLVVGSKLYGTPLDINAYSVLLVPLTVLSISGVGVALGSLISDVRAVGTLSQLAFIIVMFASPVLIPMDRLPPAIQWFSYALPTTYAAEGFRQALAGQVDTSLFSNIIVLALFALLSILATTIGLSWRKN